MKTDSIKIKNPLGSHLCLKTYRKFASEIEENF